MDHHPTVKDDMPIHLDPSRVATFSLAIDGGMDDTTRPTFDARVLTHRQESAFHKQIHAVTDINDPDARTAGILSLIETIIAGWSNLNRADGSPVEAVSDLPDVLTTTELWELIYGGMNAVTLLETDLKKSAALSASATSAAG
jgi:hypothetical protein